MIIGIFSRRIPWNDLILFIQYHIVCTKDSIGYHCYHLWLTFTGDNQYQEKDENRNIFHINAGINFIKIITDLKRQYRSFFVFHEII